jgi:xylulokinase
MVRAVMEGVTFGLRDSLELVRSLGVEVREIVLVGGGAKSALWRQIQADVFGQSVCTLDVKDAAPFGAALLAGVGANIFGDCGEAVRQMTKKVEETTPLPKNVEIYDRGYSLYRGLYPANRDAFHGASELSSSSLPSDK